MPNCGHSILVVFPRQSEAAIDRVPVAVDVQVLTGYIKEMIHNELGRRLRERNISALSSDRKLDLNDRERAAILAMMPDRGWRSFVQRWRRRRTV